MYPGEDGYWIAECLSLLGCVSQGKTKNRLSRILKRQFLYTSMPYKEEN
jgi:predicted RNase H-like HicB family nuclease